MHPSDLTGDSVAEFDIVIFGGGIAGLWLLNILIKARFKVLLVEKDKVGGFQTIASQGMIHGGQRYLLGGNLTMHAASVSSLPARWDACLDGVGELDLTGVRILSRSQVMWSTGGSLAHLALNTATHLLNAKLRKLSVREFPDALAGLTGVPVFELPEKVLDIASLVDALLAPYTSNICRGNVDSLTRDGRVTVSGLQIKAQVIICAAGIGNEGFLSLLDAGNDRSQRRPLRQLMVKAMPFPLYGHGITTSYRPRVTVTSHPLTSGGFVWYLGGALADDTLALTDDEAIAFAKKEMKSIFVHLDWNDKMWATWYGMRGEAYCQSGRLPSGPVVQEYSNVLVVWPTKLTLTPLLGDYVLAHLAKKGVSPRFATQPEEPLALALPEIASFPWAQADWKI